MNKYSPPVSKAISMKVVVIYAVFGFLWILFSDLVLQHISGGAIPAYLSILKGFFFVFFTSVLIYVLVRRATLIVAHTENRQQLLFNNMSEAVFVHAGAGADGLPGCFVDVNDAACARLGYSREEFLRMRPADIDDPETLPAVPAVMQKLERDGSVVWEGVHMTKDGRKIPVEISNRKFDLNGRSLILSIARDMTERQRSEKALLRHQELLETASQAAQVALWELDLPVGVLEWGAIVDQMLGYESMEFPRTFDAWKESLHPDDRAEVLRQLDLHLVQGVPYSVEYRIRRKDGSYVWWGDTGSCRRDEQGKAFQMAGACVDITDSKLVKQDLEKEHNLLRTLLDNIPDSVYVKDREGRKILTNRSDLDFIGMDNEADVLGKTDAEVFPGHLANEYVKDDESVLRNARPVINREEIVENAAGIKRWLLTSKIPLKEAGGAVIGLVGIGRDITERKLLESKLLTMAHYDSLTTLPNRTLFLEKANMGLAHAKRAGLQCAILFVDLDHFKSVNDTLGHSIGDALLKDTAVKLAECVRETDVMARLGGDEFIIMLNDLDNAEGAQHIAERIREKLNVPRVVAGNDLFITASVGIVTYPHDGETLEDLLKNADTAMYAAKEGGRNAYCFYDQLMNQKAVSKMQVERGLREALVKNELALFYQPIVNVKDGKVRGFEALLRWFRAEGGLVFPDEFIPVAEETGLIIPIGEWVLYEACRFNRMLMDNGFTDMVMSVNISVAQLRRKNIVDIIKGAVEASGIPPHALEIEVTESMFIDSFEAAIEVLNGVRALGVQVSLDDFGTGYSSLVHLQRLPIANLKIDRLFIKEIAKDTDENAMIPAIIDLAHKLNLSVVAEGVETNIQLEKLAVNNCDYFQGFFLSRPMPAVQVLPFLKKEISGETGTA